jgi:hypothetical protein
MSQRARWFCLKIMQIYDGGVLAADPLKATPTLPEAGRVGKLLLSFEIRVQL